MNRKVRARPRGIAFNSSSLLVAIVIALGSLLGVAIPATVATISTGTLLVTVKTCGQDVSGMTNEDQIRSLCSGSLQGSSVGLSFPEGGTQFSQLNDQSAGQFAFTIVGPYVLIAPQVAGFPNAVGTCTSGNDFGGGRTPLGLRFGSEYSFDVPDAGTRVQCTMWLYATANDPGPPAKQQTVYLQALSCASDLSNTIDPAAMAADCVTALTGVDVTLADEAGDSLTNATDSNGMTRFSVPTGALSLSVAIPDQFSGGWKVCNQFDEKSNPVSGPEIHPLSNGAGAPVTISSPGNIAKCLVYLYTGTQREPGISGRIFLCDTDLSDVTLDQFQSLNPTTVCGQVATNTRVVIQDVVTQTSQELTTAGDGTFLFQTGTTGNFQVVPVPQSSIYTSMLGFCQFMTPQLTVEATDLQQTTPNGGMPVNIRESSPIANCQFLIFDPSQAKPGETLQPGDTTTAEIRVAARLCPSGFSSSNFDQLDATCSASPDPINFTAGGQAKTSTNGEFATFPGLTPGSITVTEETLDGFGQAVVFCGKTNVGSNDLPVSTQRTVVEGIPLRSPLAEATWSSVPGSTRLSRSSTGRSKAPVVAATDQAPVPMPIPTRQR